MRIVDILSEDLIIADLKSESRDDVLAEIVDCMSTARKEIDRAFALRVLIERERVGSTAVGNGLAFPHARMPALQRVVGCLARSKKGVAFRASDSQPTTLFVGILAPETGGLHLKALACASRMFKDPELRARLMRVDDRQTMWSQILDEDRRLSQCE